MRVIKRTGGQVDRATIPQLERIALLESGVIPASTRSAERRSGNDGRLHPSGGCAISFR
ncbi:MAG: hypothetical protein IPL14_16150 [Nitrospira sp.]|nr:hypothetical protein [Nitrospira sp.]